ncbi:MAG: hypothetical protein JWO02_2185, partial [Solirubrobacterales bacterium]|nr:hypothetical protein [Solirubrobacterales bacterium]
LVRERARRLVAAGVIEHEDDVAHLTWDELLEPPAAARDTVGRRSAEQQQLVEDRVPRRVTAVGPSSAVAA